jgi:dTDP-4-dehydrorhamnose 3,5-epimerase
MGSIEGVLLTQLRIIGGASGNVMHAIKNNETAYQGFGEAYFSTVEQGQVKGWKKHTKMLLNIIVPAGEIYFVLFDDRRDSPSYHTTLEVSLSPENYQRLTVPPGVWMAFKGMGNGLNMLLNVASIVHDPLEAENLPIKNDLIPYSGFL